MKMFSVINMKYADVLFEEQSRKLILRYKGIVSASQLLHIREIVREMFQSLKASTLQVDISQSEYQEFDFSAKDTMAFYKAAEMQGIKKFELKYNNENFVEQLLNQWKVFFDRNQIGIKVSEA